MFIKKQASKASLYLHTYSLSLSSCRILSRTSCLNVILWRLYFSFLSVVFFGAKSIILSASEWNIDVWTIDIGKRFFVPLSTSKVQDSRLTWLWRWQGESALSPAGSGSGLLVSAQKRRQSEYRLHRMLPLELESRIPLWWSGSGGRGAFIGPFEMLHLWRQHFVTHSIL